MIHIENEIQFENTIKEGITLVDFYATWCGPCRMIAPILEEIDESYNSSIKIAKVDVDECSIIASKYGISAIPSLLIFKDNELVTSNVGFMPKSDIEELIEKTLTE